MYYIIPISKEMVTEVFHIIPWLLCKWHDVIVMKHNFLTTTSLVQRSALPAAKPLSAAWPRRARVLASAAILSAAAATGPAAWAGIAETGTNNPSGGPFAGQLNIIGSNGGTGTLTVDNGSSLSMTGVQAGSGGLTSNGTIVVDGAGTLVTLTGVGTGPLVAGFDGTGKVVVSGGALVDASSGANNAFVGLTGGSNGTLLVTGAGSTLKLSASNTSGADLYVGNSAVFTKAAAGFDAGSTTLVGTGTATVSAGGKITGTGLVVGGVSIGLPGTLGSTGGANGTVTIAGANSAMTFAMVAPGNAVSVGYNAATVPGAVGTGNLTIAAGGAMNMSVAAGAASGTAPVVNIGGNGGNAGGIGTVTIDGGSMNFTGSYSGTNTPSLSVGRNQGTGTMTVQNGGTVNGLNVLRVGRDGSTGTMTVDGAGSVVSLKAQGTASAALEVGFVNAAGQAPAGVTTATGTMTIQNGGQTNINLDTVAGGGVNIGRRGATGTLTVTGAGSQLSLAGTNAGSTSTLPGIAVGRSGAGTMNVTAGGQVVVNDSTGYGGVNVGGSGGQVSSNEAAGTGTVLVDGAGSAIAVQSSHGGIAIGRSGTGTMTVQNGGAVSAENVVVGRDSINPGNPSVNPGAVGTLTVTGAGTTMTIAGNDGAFGTVANAGARLSVGTGATGTVTVANGAQVTIAPDAGTGSTGGGLYVGGGIASATSAGKGTMSVTGGSSVTIGGAATNSAIAIGGNGTGTLTVDTGSTVGFQSTGQTFVGAPAPNTAASAPRNGTVSVAGGSTFNAGSFLGVGSDGTNHNTGNGSFVLSGASKVNATSIFVGQNGVFGGNGTVNGAVTNMGGTLQVGASPDALFINGSYFESGGNINLEIFSDGHGGFLTDSLIFSNPALATLHNVTFNFAFQPDADPLAFLNSGAFNLSTFLFSGDGTANTPLGTSTILGMLDSTTAFCQASSASYSIDSISFTSPCTATALTETAGVPEPATWGLGLVWAGAMAALRRRRGGAKPETARS